MQTPIKEFACKITWLVSIKYKHYSEQIHFVDTLYANDATKPNKQDLQI